MSAVATGAVAAYFTMKLAVLPELHADPHVVAAPAVEAAHVGGAKAGGEKVAAASDEPGGRPSGGPSSAASGVATGAGGSHEAGDTPTAAGAASSPVSAVEPAVAASGPATIETAVAVAPHPPGADAAKPNVAASLNNIQQVLARAEGQRGASDTTKPGLARGGDKAPKAEKAEKVDKRDKASGDKTSARARERERGASTYGYVEAPAKAAAKSADNDAALLAAMLPHLKRSTSQPTSPVYEKRCGRLMGAAEAECRVKFCNGREGSDAACPPPQP